MKRFINEKNITLNGKDYSLARGFLVRVMGENLVEKIEEEFNQVDVDSLAEGLLETMEEYLTNELKDMGYHECKDCGKFSNLDEHHSLKNGEGVCINCYHEEYAYCDDINCHGRYVEKYEDMERIEGLGIRDGWYCKECAKNLNNIKKGLKHYRELKEWVKNSKLSFEELYSHFKGWHKDEELFDFNYKSLTATITNRNNQVEVSSSIEIWNDRETELVSVIDADDYETGVDFKELDEILDIIIDQEEDV